MCGGVFLCLNVGFLSDFTLSLTHGLSGTQAGLTELCEHIGDIHVSASTQPRRESFDHNISGAQLVI